MEKLDQSLATFVDKLQSAGFDQAPEVVAGAIRAVYWDGVIQLGIAVLCIALLVLFIGIIIISSIRDNTDVMCIGVFGGAIVFMFTVLANTVDNPWLRVFDPQAAFYQQIMQAIF